MLWHYYQYPLYGILMNLLVLPLVPMLMYSGLLAIGIGSFFRAGGVAAVGAGHYIMEYYSRLAAWQSSFRGTAWCWEGRDWGRWEAIISVWRCS